MNEQNKQLNWDEEIWGELKDYPNYAVSNYGRIKRIKRGIRYKNRNVGLILKQYLTKEGYLQVFLCLNKQGTYKGKYIHQLVLETFTEKPSQKYEPNHKNGIKTDNKLDNLEWVTRKENLIHASKLGLLPKEHPWAKGKLPPNTKLKREEVLEIKKLLKINNLTHKEISKKYNIGRATITAINMGIIWKTIN